MTGTTLTVAERLAVVDAVNSADFDTVFELHPDGTVRQTDAYAPSVYLDLDDDGDAIGTPYIDGAAWEILADCHPSETFSIMDVTLLHYWTDYGTPESAPIRFACTEIVGVGADGARDDLIGWAVVYIDPRNV